MNPNDSIFFLNSSKNKMVFRPMFPTAPPFDFVIAKSAAKIAPVQLVKNLTEIEVFAFLAKI